MNANWKHFALLVAGVVSLQAIFGMIVYISLGTWTERGTFGDMFGVVNSLFSGLAFAGVIYTIFLQHKELSLQREELTLTRQELSRSASAQEKSEQALAAQARAATITARLAAANYLYSEAERTISSVTMYTHGSAAKSLVNSAKQTKEELMKDIRTLYNSLREIDAGNA